jgi:uncharacterized membrane-anchored protein
MATDPQSPLAQTVTGIGRTRAVVRTGVSKVPEITALFWVIKVLTTGMGEATSDYLVHRFPPPVAVACTGVVLAVALWVQFRAPRYRVWRYWFGVVMVSVFGTMAADAMHVALHIPYLISTTFYAIVLAGIFVTWNRSEHTLSIHSILTRRREAFYWATVMATFALGTAAGDMTAHTLGLGYLGSGIMFTGMICVPYVAWRWFGLNAIAAFWWAYVLTRPLGASFADWMGVDKSAGGLGFGRGSVAVGLSIAIVILVGYLAVSGDGDPGSSGARAS